MTMRAAAFVLILASIAAPIAALAAELPPVEESVEATTDAVSLPSTRGRMIARSCPTCPERYLSLNGQSRIFIGEEEVNYAKLKQAMNAARQSLTIHYREKDKTVTRIVLSPRE